MDNEMQGSTEKINFKIEKYNIQANQNVEKNIRMTLTERVQGI